MTIEATLNGKEVIVTLDSAASASVMSKKIATELGIATNRTMPTSYIKGVNRNPIPCSMSEPVEISVDKIQTENVRFLLIDKDIPIIIAKPDLAKLRIKLDPFNNSIKTSSRLCQ